MLGEVDCLQLKVTPAWIIWLPNLAARIDAFIAVGAATGLRTVRLAALLVTLPKPLVITHSNWVPVFDTRVAGVVYEALVAPLPPLTFT